MTESVPGAPGPASDAVAQATRGDAELARQLATLDCAALTVTPGTALAAAVWWNGLLRLGFSPPLVVVHDLGMVLSRNRGVAVMLRTPLGQDARPPRADAAVLARYWGLLEAASALPADAATLDGEGLVGLRDEIVVVLLARLLGDLDRRSRVGGAAVGLVSVLPLASPLYHRPPAHLARQHAPEWAVPFLRALIDEQELMLLRLRQTELGVFRLLGATPAGAPDLPALYQLANTTGAGQIADFSLQLLPSLLETKRASSVQRFAVDGYASVERRGSVDALLPSELAHEADTFAQRALSDELLYYGHERPHEGQRRSHGILIDASASMRGQREVVARGLALALARKLALLGGDVWLAFFDSRMHRRIDAAALAGRELPYFLCFRSEHGRNYARAFAEVRDEISVPARRHPQRETAITFITHGECHIPIPIVQTIRQHATLCGIFVLPSQPLLLDYLPLLSGHHVLTAVSMADAQAVRRRGLAVVKDVVAATNPASAGATANPVARSFR